MNRRHLARLASAGSAVLLAVSVVATPAFAASTPAISPAAPVDAATTIHCASEWLAARANPTVETVKAAGTCEVDRRLATIERLGTAVGSAPALTVDHKAALQKILDDSAAGLTALKAEIAGDTTLAQLREDVGRIFTEYRIYALVTRQVRLVRAADAVDAAAAKLTDTASDLASVVTQLEATGKDVTQAKAHLDAMRAAIADATAAVDGVAAKVLAQTPATWNAGTAGPVLRSARDAIVAARGDLRTALTEARAVIAALA